eukprot:456985_1
MSINTQGLSYAIRQSESVYGKNKWEIIDYIMRKQQKFDGADRDIDLVKMFVENYKNMNNGQLPRMNKNEETTNALVDSNNNEILEYLFTECGLNVYSEKDAIGKAIMRDRRKTLKYFAHKLKFDISNAVSEEFLFKLKQGQKHGLLKLLKQLIRMQQVKVNTNILQSQHWNPDCI